MRRRNRKKRSYGFSLPVPFAGVVVLVVALGLAYVWLGCRCESLGAEIVKLDSQIGVAEKQRLNEEFKWTQMKSPRNLEAALAARHLTMAYPRPEQIVRLDAAPAFDQLADTGKRVRYPRRERLVMNE